MSIEFDGIDVAANYISCGSGASIDDLWDGGATLLVRAYIDTIDTNERRLWAKTVNWISVINITAVNKVQIAMNFSGDNGRWQCAAPDTGTWVDIIVTYNADSVDNNPSVYINNVSQEITETSAPTNARDSDAASSGIVGGYGDGTYEYDGQLEDYRLVDRIITTEERALYSAGYRGPLGGEILWLSMSESRGAFTGTLTQGTHILPDLSANTNDGDPYNGCVLQPSKAPRYGVAV